MEYIWKIISQVKGQKSSGKGGLKKGFKAWKLNSSSLDRGLNTFEYRKRGYLKLGKTDEYTMWHLLCGREQGLTVLHPSQHLLHLLRIRVRVVITMLLMVTTLVRVSIRMGFGLGKIAASLIAVVMLVRVLVCLLWPGMEIIMMVMIIYNMKVKKWSFMTESPTSFMTECPPFPRPVVCSQFSVCTILPDYHTPVTECWWGQGSW